MVTFPPLAFPHQVGPVGPTYPTRVLAELGLTMEGNLDRAIALAKACKQAGAWGIKVQMLTPGGIAAPDAPIYWDTAPGMYANQAEAFEAQAPIGHLEWGPLRDWCSANGMAFVATPFDLEACEALGNSLAPTAVKVASGDVTNLALLDWVAYMGCPVILSLGASSWAEAVTAIARVARHGSPVIPLACTLRYPTPAEDAHLARIPTIREGLGQALEAGLLDRTPGAGYSDHTTGVNTGMAAAVLGAVLVEKHVTDGQAVTSPDNDMALAPAMLGHYVTATNLGSTLRGDPHVLPHPEEVRAREGARRHVHVVRDLPAGTIITREDVVALRPHTHPQVGAEHLPDLIGKVTVHPLAAGPLLRHPEVQDTGLGTVDVLLDDPFRGL